MKKVLRSITAALFGVLLMGATASAQSSISNTGPGSTNTISQNNSLRCDVKNDTSVNINGSITQNSSSGNATVSGNTSGGNATSGSASNSNRTSVNIAVTNTGVPCVRSTTAEPEKPSGGTGGSQTNGGSGGGVVLADGTEITALPETGASSTPAEVIVGMIALASGAGLFLPAIQNFRKELAL